MRWVVCVAIFAVLVLAACDVGQAGQETPIPTSTPTPTPTPTGAQPSLPTGWRDHAASGVHIALPERWKAVDVRGQGVEAIWNSLEGLNTEWAQNVTATYSAKAVQRAMKFWAMDSKPAGIGNATVTITSGESQPFPIELADLCAQMQSLYEQTGFEVLAVECDLEINGLDAARFTLNAKMGSMAIKMYGYLYVQEGKLWVVTLGVDGTAWSEYEQVFVIAAESFAVD